MPDGTVVAGVPDGITQSQLMARYQSYNKPTLSAEAGQDISRGFSNVGTDIAQNQENPAMAGLKGTSDLVSAGANVAGDVIKRVPGYDTAKAAVNSAGEWVGDTLLNNGAAPALDAMGNPIRQAASDLRRRIRRPYRRRVREQISLAAYMAALDLPMPLVWLVRELVPRRILARKMPHGIY